MIIIEYGTNIAFDTDTRGIKYFCDFSPCICTHVPGWYEVKDRQTNISTMISDELFRLLNKGEHFTIRKTECSTHPEVVRLSIHFTDEVYTVDLPKICLHPVAKENKSTVTAIDRFIPGRWYRLRKINEYTRERWGKDERRIFLDGGSHKCVAASIFVSGGEGDKKLCEYAGFEGMKKNKNQERGLWRLIPMGETDLRSWEDMTERVAWGEAKKKKIVAAYFDTYDIDPAKVHDGLFSKAAYISGMPREYVNPLIDNKKEITTPYLVMDVVETKDFLDNIFSSMGNTRNNRRLRRRGEYAVVEPPQVTKTRNSENS